MSLQALGASSTEVTVAQPTRVLLESSMFLREYIYVDIDKVSGLVSQINDGVPEKASSLEDRQRQFQVDFQAIKGGSGSSSQEHVEKSLSDFLFKELEGDLESFGVLQDVSEDLMNYSSPEDLEDILVPGNILRITAPGTIFHSAQLSDSLVGLATAAQGITELNSDPTSGDPAPVPPKAKSQEQKKAERAAKIPAGEPRFPEDFLPNVKTIPLIDASRDQLGGMIKVVRSIFGEGVHVHLRPAGPDGPIISARLEGGRRFLDSSPEVLLSRYGLAEQEWTIVGIVGQVGKISGATEEDPDITNSDGSINRADFVGLVETFLSAAQGLVDLPQYPGFSMVPLALYRNVGGSITETPSSTKAGA